MSRAMLPLLLVVLTALAVAGVTSDVRIDTDRDSKQNKIFKLVNTGTKNVKVKVEHTKTCSGVTNNRKPEVREHWLTSGQIIELGKAWRSSTCEHRWRIVSAEYY